MRYVNGKYIRDADYVPPKASRRYVDHSWTTTKELPCGRLRLVAYSPYWSVSWSAQWQETKKAPLTRELGAIVKALEEAAVELVEKLNEAARQAEIERLERLAAEQRRRQEEDRRRVQQSFKDSQAQLVQIIQAWADVMNVERISPGGPGSRRRSAGGRAQRGTRKAQAGPRVPGVAGSFGLLPGVEDAAGALPSPIGPGSRCGCRYQGRFLDERKIPRAGNPGDLGSIPAGNRILAWSIRGKTNLHQSAKPRKPSDYLQYRLSQPPLSAAIRTLPPTAGTSIRRVFNAVWRRLPPHRLPAGVRTASHRPAGTSSSPHFFLAGC